MFAATAARRLATVLPIVFFTILFFVLFFLINPARTCFLQQPLFLLDTRFFSGFAGLPGGLCEYLAKHNVWGSVDTVLSHENAGGSISWPRISPDGRFLLFCLSDYGYFTIHNPLSDLHILDLKTGSRRLLDINSNRVESYHSWSSNGRWFVFSSKRRDGLLARPYFAYFDRCGGVHKAFLLPQKDPSFYDTFLKNYNIPELITAPWRPAWRDLYRIVRREARGVRFDEAAAADALSGASVKGALIDTSTIH
jgi:dipeptidyl aminopeptidase/acylaminoacyl peptidase